MISFKEFVLKEDLNTDAKKIIDYIKEPENKDTDLTDANKILEILDNDTYVNDVGEVSKELLDKVEELKKDEEDKKTKEIKKPKVAEPEEIETASNGIPTFQKINQEEGKKSKFTKDLIKNFLSKLVEEQTKNARHYSDFIQTGKMGTLFDNNNISTKSIQRFLSNCKNGKYSYPKYEDALAYIKQLLLINLFNYSAKIFTNNAVGDAQVIKNLRSDYGDTVFNNVKRLKMYQIDNEEVKKILNTEFNFDKLNNYLTSYLKNIKILSKEALKAEIEGTTNDVNKDENVINKKEEEKANNEKTSNEKNDNSADKEKQIENIYNVPKIDIPLYFNSKEEFDKSKNEYFSIVDDMCNKVNDEIKKYWDSADKEHSDFINKKNEANINAEKKSKAFASSSWGKSDKDIKEELLESIPIIGRMNNKLVHSYKEGQEDKDSLSKSFENYINKFKRTSENLFNRLDPSNKYNYSSYEKANCNRKLKANLYDLSNKLIDFSYKAKKRSEGRGILKQVSKAADYVKEVGKHATDKIKNSDININRTAHNLEDVNNITASLTKFLNSNPNNEKDSMLRDRLSNCLYGGLDSQHGVRNFDELNSKICYFFDMTNFNNSGDTFYKNLVKELSRVQELEFFGNNYYNNSISESIEKIIFDRSSQTSKWKSNATSFTTIMQKAKLFAKVINDEINSSQNGLESLGSNGIADPNDQIIIKLSNRVVGIDKKILSKVIGQGCAWYNNSYLKVANSANANKNNTNTNQKNSSVLTSAAVGDAVPQRLYTGAMKRKINF